MSRDLLPLRVTVEPFLLDGRQVIRVAFAGRAGVGSDGNVQGEQIRQTLANILLEHRPTRLLIDLSELDYQFGDWIGACAHGCRAPVERACVLLGGASCESLREFWTVCRLDRVIPLVRSREEAENYLRDQSQRPGD